MKICIASDTYPPHVNGASYFTARLAKALADDGHEVAVIAPSRTLHHEDETRGGVFVYGVRSFPGFMAPDWRFVAPFFISGRIRRALDEFEPDVVHAQMHFWLSRAVMSEAQRRGIPIVATNHFMPENITHYLHLPRMLTDAVDASLWKDAARAYRAAYCVTSPTETAARFLRRYWRKPVRVISNGIDLKRFNPDNDPRPARDAYHLPGKPTLLFVGRHDREKQIDVVLRAVASARKKLDLQFVSVGRGAEGGRLKELARDLGIEDSVTFAGFVPDGLMPSVYAAADCFVNAGIAELQCIAALEAMASGLPILAARAVALPELVHDGKNGYAFAPGDSEELARRIVEILSDAKKRKEMGAESLRVIAPHDLIEVLGQFTNLYREAQKDARSSSAKQPAALHRSNN